MNIVFMIYAIVIIIAGGFYIATSSIAQDCVNANPDYAKKNQSNAGFIISNLVCAVLITLSGLIGIYFAYKAPA